MKGSKGVCSGQPRVCATPPKLVLFSNEQGVGVKNFSAAGSRGCASGCRRGVSWGRERTALGCSRPDAMGAETNRNSNGTIKLVCS